MSSLLSKSLSVICPSCDFLNVVGAVRCMSCGQPTDGAAAPQKAQAGPAGPQPAPPGLRRSGVQSAPELATTPPGPSGSMRGPPQRPTFQSSTQPAIAAQPGPRFSLTVLAGPARGQRFRLSATGAQIGRNKGVILFPDDPFVSPLHASLVIRDGKLFVRDEGSTSGVFVGIHGQETITDGGTFCTGLRLFRYLGAIEPAADWNKRDVLVYGAPLPSKQTHYALEEVLLGDRPGRCLLTPGPTLSVGQARCDFSYPNDEGLAPKHCELAPTPKGVTVKDLSGGLGTYVRISTETPLKAGDRFRVGQQTLQVEAQA